MKYTVVQGFISFVIVPMAITLRCHSYGSKHMMDGRIESRGGEGFIQHPWSYFSLLSVPKCRFLAFLGILFIADRIIPNTVDECAAFNLTPTIALKPVITATPVINHFLQHLF